MICPHCGNDINDDEQQCPHCNTSLNSGAHWGVRTSTPYTAGASPTSAYIAATPRHRKSNPFLSKIAAVVIAAALLGGMGYAGFTYAQNQAASSAEEVIEEQTPEEKALAKWHAVTIAVQASGFDESSTPLPVEVTGADSAGKSFSQIAYIKSDGTGLRLPAGNFGIRPAASPITSTGGMFLFNASNKWFSVDAELEPGAPLDVSADIQIVLEPADPSDLSVEGVESAKSYAISSGMSEESVDQLLEAVRTAISELQSKIAFSTTQRYRNTTYVGDVHTTSGVASAAGIEGTQAMPVRTDLFLFTNNTLYYADDSQRSSQDAIALHSRNMATGMETILATDLCSQTLPFYANGFIVYEALENGNHVIKRVGSTPEDITTYHDRLPWAVTKLVGITDDAVLVASSDNELPKLSTLPLGEGEVTTVDLGEQYGNVLGVYNEHVLVSIPGWETNQLLAYGLDGTKLWEVEAPAAAKLNQLSHYDDTYVYGLNSDSQQIARIDLANGESRIYDLGIPYAYDIMLIRDGHLFFAGSDTYNDDPDNVKYSVYDLNLDNGEVANIGSYETPQNEETATQEDTGQDGGSWNNTWTDTTNTWNGTGQYYDWNTGTYTDGTTGYGYGNTYGYGTGTTDNTYGYGNGTSTTDNTYGYGYGTGTTDNTYGYGYGTGTNTYGYGYGGTGYTDGTTGWGTGTGTGTYDWTTGTYSQY